jgi:hypothetical protein
MHLQAGRSLVRGFLAARVMASVVLGALAGGGTAAPSSTSAGVVWSAGMETADLSEWSRNDTDGGSWDSGDCDRPPKGVSSAVSHTGRYSMAMAIDTSDGEAGCRQARYEESKRDRAYYCGAWLYLPRYSERRISGTSSSSSRRRRARTAAIRSG